MIPWGSVAAIGLLVSVAFFNAPQVSYSEAYWSALIENAGPERAFVRLQHLSISVEKRHIAEHAFGGALFDATFSNQGFEGYVVCAGDGVATGCMHEYIGRALAEDGLEAFERLASICARSSVVSNCFHSLGHGLVAFFGYDAAHLDEARPVCGTLNGDARLECLDGVFMEYNERNMLFAEPEYRDVSEEERAAPCVFSEAIERYACLRRLPTVFRESVYAGDAEALAPEFKKMCSVFAGTWERVGCYRGVGEAFIRRSGYDPVRLAVACDSAAETAMDRLVCRAGAAYYHRVLYKNDADRARALVTCDGLSENDSATCHRFATGVLSIESLISELQESAAANEKNLSL